MKIQLYRCIRSRCTLLICTIHCFLADRAKAIKTKAVVNESPTEKLIRELREENQKLMDQLKMAGQPIIVPGEPGQPQMVGVSEEGKLLRVCYPFIAVQSIFSNYGLV